MSVDEQEKSGSRAGSTVTPQEVVETIITEAEACETSATGPDLQTQIRESENKRRLLAEALHASRQQMRQLLSRSEGERDRALPFGVFVRPGRTPETVVIKHHGRLYEAKVKMAGSPAVRPGTGGTFHARLQRQQESGSPSGPGRFKKGELLLLDNDLNVIDSRGFDLVSGSLGVIQQVLNEEKLLIKTVGEENVVVTRAEPLLGRKILSGDNVEYDPESLFAYAILPKSAVDRLVLEKLPDISYDDIGGLDEAIELIRDAIELPHLYPELFREHKLTPPKGFLLYGPPGCGKTLIAKAVARSLAKRLEEKTGVRGESLFLNVKGPELLNKYVGETEQAIRDLFARARSQASYHTPVIIFFDEMDAMFRIRGAGISSDMEATIVPQFLAELDGIEPLDNVVVIGATNREDLIDPAVLRPDQKAAREILAKYLTPDLPLDPALLEIHGSPEAVVAWLIQAVVEEMYSDKPENELLEVTYADGSQKILYLQDFSSGAIIANIVSRAKFLAVKDFITQGRKGIRLEHLFAAMRAEYQENEELPSNTNPAEWFRVIGKGGERIVRVRSLLGQRANRPAAQEPPQEIVEVGEALA